jgi:hypothetical protein
MILAFVKTFLEFNRQHTEKCEQLRGGAYFLTAISFPATNQGLAPGQKALPLILNDSGD